MNAIYLLALVLLPSALCAWQPPIVLNDTTTTYNLQDYLDVSHVEYLQDRDHLWTIAEVNAPDFDSLFVADKNSIPQFKETNAAYWMRFQLRDSTTVDRRWLLNTRRYRTFVLRRIFDFGLWPGTDLKTKYAEIRLCIPWAGSPGNTTYNYPDFDHPDSTVSAIRDIPGAGLYLIREAPAKASFAARDLPYRGFAFHHKRDPMNQPESQSPVEPIWCVRNGHNWHDISYSGLSLYASRNGAE